MASSTPVSPASRRLTDLIALAALCAAFVAVGWHFLTRFGIEVDEALVGNGIYARAAAIYSWTIGEAEIPVMLLSYLGALKTWMYNAIFAIWHPDAIPLRLPTLLFGAATLVLFFVTLRRVAGRGAAWMGALLLASDPSFLLNETIDFGPVALHHLLKLGAVLLLIRYAERPRAWLLAGGCFLLGVAMWDKAIFAWALAGLVAAALAVYPREVLARLSARAALIGTVAFLAGAAPLISYNIARPMDTVRSNARLASTEGMAAGKVWLLRQTVNGHVMFGFLTAVEPGPKPGRLHRSLGQFANGNVAASLLALLAIPFLWRHPARRPMLFAAVYFVVTWLFMFFTSGAGAAAHHVLLLWPAHLAVIAMAADAPGGKLRRPALALVALLIGMNVLVLHQYTVELARNGTSVRWTDAFPGLMQSLRVDRAERVFVVDWGILETVNLMTEGAVPVVGIGECDIGPPLFADPHDLFVTHGAPYVQFPHIGAKLELVAAGLGLERVPVSTIYDRNGRGIFEVFRYRRR